MQSWTRSLSLGLCLAAIALAGCAVHTHKTVSTYDYDDSGRPQPVEREHVDSEYHMVTPGTMVVEPRR